ncbi:sorting nexin lst-4-like isoform X1 [Limulus polyphemus]|uniref:Sorting nexin n=1 Tax=Limulus polyphemus TaxID=6850 RepID=A0ABM1SRK0_LIMPO|nr:sorting nexin lst-4-like isoform X1 [Limulus polyphemus]
MGTISKGGIFTFASVRALYDFEAQPGTGELSIWNNEILTLTRQDVGEGWWEGTNERGETGLFPAGYVEIISSQPPAVPPPPPPRGLEYDISVVSSGQDAPQDVVSYEQFEAGDDWDDDWDDDELTFSSQQEQFSGPGMYGVSIPDQSWKSSSTGDIRNTTPSGQDASGMWTVKKSINRFSTFVKSGGEAFILGETKINVPANSIIQILDVDGEIMWAFVSNPYTCSVTSPKKETKLKGLKSFIAYQITPSYNNIQVSRRYKHFDWLHERLEAKFNPIPIPPLPDKQISGRYQEEFVEHRRAQLQMWVDRICRHPVLSQSDVWKHFITCADEKKWKAGKRKAEKDELVGASFFLAIQPPETFLDPVAVEQKTDHFQKFVTKFDDSVKQLFMTSLEQSKKYAGGSTHLTAAVKHTADTYEEIGKLYEEQPKLDFEPMCDVLHEYKGMLAAWPDILQLHKGAMNKRKDYQRLNEDGKLSAEEAQSINKRTDVVSYAALAEISHFQSERIEDFKYMMQNFLSAQISFYQTVVSKLQESLSLYQQL